MTSGLSARLKALLRDTWLNPLHTARRALHRAMLSTQPYTQGRLLDIDRGRKRYQEMLAGVSAYWGIDLPDNSVQSTVVDVYADGLALPFPAHTSDTALCNEVLEHVPEPAWLLAADQL